jgi:hypothetical protein
MDERSVSQGCGLATHLVERKTIMRSLFLVVAGFLLVQASEPEATAQLPIAKGREREPQHQIAQGHPFGGAVPPNPAITKQPAAEKSLRATTVTKEAGLGDSRDVDAALAKAFEDAPDVLVGKERTKRPLRNCLDLLGFDVEKIQTESPPDIRVILDMAAHCYALALLRDAQGSKESFIEGLRLDAHAPQWLPADLYFYVSLDEERRVRAAVRAGRGWQSFDPKVRAKIDQWGELQVDGHGYGARLVEYARGDFDHDGIEDILIRRQAYPKGGTMLDYSVFLLTRVAENKPVRVLKLWRHSY